MLFAIFKILRETMVGTDNGCKVLRKFSAALVVPQLKLKLMLYMILVMLFFFVLNIAQTTLAEEKN